MKFAVDQGYISRNPCNSDDRKEIKGVVIERGGYSHDHIARTILKVEKTLYLDTFIMPSQPLLECQLMNFKAYSGRTLTSISLR